MKQNRAFATLIFIIILGAGAALAYARQGVAVSPEVILIGVAAFIVASVASAAIQVADQRDWVRIVPTDRRWRNP